MIETKKDKPLEVSEKNKMSEENKKPKFSMDDLQEIELPKFDPKPFIGKEAMVDEITPDSRTQANGKESHFLIFKALVDPTGFNGEPLYATRLVGVQVDENGQFGWGEDTAMAKFLKANGVSHPKEMKGKKVIVQTQKDSTYLTF